MMDAGVLEVKISHKNVCIHSETSKLETNDLKELIAVLKAAQKSTNECLTILTNESGVNSGSEDDSEDDLSVDNEPELSPKRAKLKD